MLTEIVLPIGSSVKFEVVANDGGVETTIAAKIALSDQDAGKVMIGTVKNDTEYQCPKDIVYMPNPTVPPVTTPPTVLPPLPKPTTFFDMESKSEVTYVGKTVTFKLKADGIEIDATKGLITWGLSSVVAPPLPPPAGSTGTVPGTVPTIDAKTGVYTGGTAGSKAKVTLHIVTAVFEIKWPADWPIFSEKDKTWKDEPGKRALKLFYGAFSLMPEIYRKELKDIIIYRMDGTGKDERSFFTPFYTKISDAQVTKLIPATNLRGWDDSYYILTMIHELGHAFMAVKCKKTVEAYTPIIIEGIAVLLALIGAAGLFVGCMCIPIAIDISLATLASYQDYMSKFCEKTDWEMSNFQTHFIPILGWLLGNFMKQRPNTYFASTGSNSKSMFYKELWGLNNTKVGDHYDWASAEMCSDYSLYNPQEDFAECISCMAFKLDVIQNGHSNGSLTCRKPIKERLLFMETEIFGKPWAEIGYDEVYKYQDFRFNYDNTDVRPSFKTSSLENASELGIEAIPIKAEGTRTDYSALNAQIDQLNELMAKLLGTFDDSVQEALTTTRKVVSSLPEVAKATQVFHLTRALEVRSSGLQRWKEETKVAQGDVLIDKNAKLWIVAKIDDAGKPKQLVGDMEIKRDSKPEDLSFDTNTLWYTWKPNETARAWPGEGQEWTPALAEQGASVMNHLVSLWGETQTEETKGSLETSHSFFQEFLSVAKLVDADYIFNHQSSIDYVMSYCETHGEGLKRFDATKDKLMVGDVVILYHQNTVAVVTRTADGKPADIVSGGISKGILGEKDTAVKMAHGIDADVIRYYWRPSAQPKNWITN
jgi:hypothetical protein